MTAAYNRCLQAQSIQLPAAWRCMHRQATCSNWMPAYLSTYAAEPTTKKLTKLPVQRMAEEAVMGPRLGPIKAAQNAATLRPDEGAGSDEGLGDSSGSDEPGLAEQAFEAAALAPENSSSSEDDENGSFDGEELSSEDGSELAGGDVGGGLDSPGESDSGDEVDPRTLAKYERSR